MVSLSASGPLMSGPAVEWLEGTKWWHIAELASRLKSWYLNGQESTEEEFNKKVANHEM